MTPEEKADSVKEKHGARFNKLMNQAMAVLHTPRNIDWQATRLLEITNELASLVTPVAVCKKGCSHCCFQTVAISSWEAEQIAKATRKKIAEFKGYNPETDTKEEFRARYSGQPCLFLVNDECSIYDARPFACRTHISVADDSWPCDIINNPNAVVPYFNFSDLNMILSYLFLNAGCKFGDIREFFE